MVEKAGRGSAGGPESGGPSTAEDGRPLPAIDFSTFILSLSTTALFQMGLVEDPETGRRADPDAEAARHTIETLEMLREKTRGNLEEQEAKLIGSLLYELRMRYLEVRR